MVLYHWISGIRPSDFRAADLGQLRASCSLRGAGTNGPGIQHVQQPALESREYLIGLAGLVAEPSRIRQQRAIEFQRLNGAFSRAPLTPADCI